MLYSHGDTGRPRHSLCGHGRVNATAGWQSAEAVAQRPQRRPPQRRAIAVDPCWRDLFHLRLRRHAAVSAAACPVMAAAAADAPEPLAAAQRGQQ